MTLDWIIWLQTFFNWHSHQSLQDDSIVWDRVRDDSKLGLGLGLGLPLKLNI